MFSIGQGLIPFSAFRRILRHPGLLGKVPCYLETPYHTPLPRPCHNAKKQEHELQLHVIEWDMLERIIRLPDARWSESRGLVEYTRARMSGGPHRRLINLITKSCSDREKSTVHNHHIHMQTVRKIVRALDKSMTKDFQAPTVAKSIIAASLEVINQDITALREAAQARDETEDHLTKKLEVIEQEEEALLRLAKELEDIDVGSERSRKRKATDQGPEVQSNRYLRRPAITEARQPKSNKWYQKVTAESWGTGNVHEGRTLRVVSAPTYEDTDSEVSDDDAGGDEAEYKPSASVRKSVIGTGIAWKRGIQRAVSAPVVLAPSRQILDGVEIPWFGRPPRRRERAKCDQ